MGKPFVKWVGGKGRLLKTLKNHLPDILEKNKRITYIEPFVGGGAMLFYILEHFPQIKRFIISDINPGLINCYKQIKSHHKSLIQELKFIQDAFYALQDIEQKRSFYYELRNEYNQIELCSRNTIRAAALFIFLNKTCFNGLYRENKKGDFNVPFGRYTHPTICNEKVITDANKALKRVEILIGSFDIVRNHIDWSECNFFYFDPPYRPLLEENNFRQYTLNAFGDSEQEALKVFCDEINFRGGYFMLSNSDSEIEHGVSYFERLYNGYNVHRIIAPRSINVCQGKPKITEILIKNY